MDYFGEKLGVLRQVGRQANSVPAPASVVLEQVKTTILQSYRELIRPRDLELRYQVKATWPEPDEVVRQTIVRRAEGQSSEAVLARNAEARHSDLQALREMGRVGLEPTTMGLQGLRAEYR